MCRVWRTGKNEKSNPDILSRGAPRIFKYMINSWKAGSLPSIFICPSTFQIALYIKHTQASLLAQRVKNPPAMEETRVWSLGWEDPLERAWLPTPVFLPGVFHGQKSLQGTIHGVAESDMTERLRLSHFYFKTHKFRLNKSQCGHSWVRPYWVDTWSFYFILSIH